MPKIDYEKYLVRKPLLESGSGIKSRQSPVMTYMSNKLVPEAKYYVELGWIYGIPEPNPHIYEHTHDFDEIVLHIGNDLNNPQYLGGEIEYYLGGQPLTFDITTAIFVPKGIKHGPVTWKKFEKPHLEISIILGPASTEVGWQGIGTSESAEVIPQKKDDIDYEKYLVRKPILEVDTGARVKGRHDPSMTYISNIQVPGCNTYLEYAWIWDMPEPNPPIPEHTHDYDEIVLHWGSDPDNPEDLGSEIEYCLGGQPLTFNTTNAIFVPKHLKHGPLTWKSVISPHFEMAIVIGAGTLAESDPGGHRQT